MIEAAVDMCGTDQGVPISGVVYGVALNSLDQLQLLADAFTRPPYGSPPRAPVLYIKTPNTIAASGQIVTLPAGVDRADLGVTLAIVFGRTAARISPDRALDYVAGYRLALDISLPRTSHYRPGLNCNCRNGFLPLGSRTVAAQNPNGITLEVSINGGERQAVSLGRMARKAARLIADVTDFMTLDPGDILLAGLPFPAPQAGPGDHVSVSAPGFGTLECRFAGDTPQ